MDLPVNPLSSFCAEISGQCRKLVTLPSRHEIAHAAAQAFRMDLDAHMDSEDAADGIEAASRVFDSVSDSIIQSVNIIPLESTFVRTKEQIGALICGLPTHSFSIL